MRFGLDSRLGVTGLIGLDIDFLTGFVLLLILAMFDLGLDVFTGQVIIFTGLVRIGLDRYGLGSLQARS